MSKAGCFFFYADAQGSLRHPRLSVTLLVTLVSLLHCSGLGLNLKEKVEPLLPVASASASSPWGFTVGHASRPCTAVQVQPVLSSNLCWAPATGQGPSQWSKPLVLPPEERWLGGRQQELALIPPCIQKAVKVPSCFAVCTPPMKFPLSVRSFVLVCDGKKYRNAS